MHCSYSMGGDELSISKKSLVLKGAFLPDTWLCLFPYITPAAFPTACKAGLAH